MRNKLHLQDVRISSEANNAVWNTHYKREKAAQEYPDENLVRLLKHTEPGSALDFGCGSGRHIRLLSELGFGPLYGADLSQESIQICRKKFPEAEFLIPDLPDDAGFILPFPDLYFDLIVLWGVLHYNNAESVLRILDEMRRILCPGGSIMGTLRARSDTHFAENSDMQGARIQYFSREEAGELIGSFFSETSLGYIERIPVGDTKSISHWIFQAKSESSARH